MLAPFCLISAEKLAVPKDRGAGLDTPGIFIDAVRRHHAVGVVVRRGRMKQSFSIGHGTWPRITIRPTGPKGRTPLSGEANDLALTGQWAA